MLVCLLWNFSFWKISYSFKDHELKENSEWGHGINNISVRISKTYVGIYKVSLICVTGARLTDRTFKADCLFYPWNRCNMNSSNSSIFIPTCQHSAFLHGAQFQEMIGGWFSHFWYRPCTQYTGCNSPCGSVLLSNVWQKWNTFFFSISHCFLKRSKQLSKLKGES